MFYFLGGFYDWCTNFNPDFHYFLPGIVISVGLRFSRQNKSADDFYLGGRKLGPLVTAMSAEASGFVACGKLFSSLFDIGYLPAMLISALVIIGYTALGGFLAASTTDFIQSIIMSIALIVVLGFGVGTAGGFGAVIDNAKSMEGYLSLTATHNVATHEAGSYGALTIASTLAWGLGYFGMPHILLRFMAIKDDSKLKLSRRVASIWVVISLAVAVFIGIIGYSMSLKGAIPMFESKSAAENIIVQIANKLSTYNFFLALVAGVILAGILASTMSTADSQLLAASSSVSYNIIEGVFGQKLSKKAPLSWRVSFWLLLPLLAFSLQRIRTARSLISSLLHGPALAPPSARLCCFPCSGGAPTGSVPSQVFLQAVSPYSCGNT